MAKAREIEARAAEWIARRDRGDWNGADAQALDQWLGESLDHRLAFLRLESVWARADRLAALSGLASRHLRPARRAFHWRIAAAVVMCVLAGAGGAYLAASPRDSRALSTPVGGRALAPLDDGSKVELNTDTALRVAFGRGERQVWLERGEAYFDVAHDQDRPFVIRAGDARIRVVGTRFVVRRSGEETEVIVEDGKVVVGSSSGLRRSLTLARPGDMVEAGGGATRLSHPGLDVVHDALAWRRGQVVFHDTSLAEAAATFNRYNQVKLVVVGRAAHIRIGGAFDTANVDAFAGLLSEAYGLKAARRGDEIFVSD